jgi:hypothetical protein
MKKDSTISKTALLKRMEKQKRAISMIFVVLLFVQLFVFYEVSQLAGDFNETINVSNKTAVTMEEQFVSQTIRGQQRIMLNTIRQEWMQYLVENKDVELLLKDKNGLYIYANKDGNSVSFDDKTMTISKSVDNYYIIRNRKTDKVILDKCRQQWNTDQVKKILNIIATPVKAFGSTGDVIIFDSFTGEMIIDNSEDCKDTPEVLNKDGKRYITLDYKHRNNKNPTASKRVIDNEMMWRKDTDVNSGMVYYFNEPVDMKDDANNFEKYPLGQYNREFQEKIILPYESVGIDGQPMQITIVLGAQEKEIFSAFKIAEQYFVTMQKDINKNIEEGILFPLISVILSLIVITLAIFITKLCAYQCKKCNNSKESDSE